MSIHALLEDIESRLDPAVEESILDQWKTFCAGRHPGEVFSPRRPEKKPPASGLGPGATVNQALDDPEAMARQQFGEVSWRLAEGQGRILNLRANYGTPIMPVLFGAELFRMPDTTNTLPASYPLPGGAEGIRAMVERGLPGLDHPSARRVLETGRYLAQLKKQYPKIEKYVHIYHPDFQGPVDILEMLWGSDMFLGLYDEPELAHAALGLITRAYLAYFQAWEQVIPPRTDGCAAHWALLHPGRVMLRCDSAMNLSPEMYREFVLPYDRQILQALGGGAMHACGKVDHFVQDLAAQPGLRAFNPSQPELNDMEKVYACTIDRGLLLLDLNPAAVRAAQAAHRPLHGRVHSDM